MPISTWTADRPHLDPSTVSTQEWALRVDLAAAFRLAYAFDWTESVGNHFSAILPEAPGVFLMNPRWMLFSAVRASDLMRLDWNDKETLARPNPPDRSGWCIHSQMHALNPAARVVLHIHPPYATALAGLTDPTLKPIDQVTARFFGMVAVDSGFEDVAVTEDEGRRLAVLLGDKSVLMMGNHGLTVAASDVPSAFEELYLFERACRTLVLAYGSGQPLNAMSDKVAATVARGWLTCREMAHHHFGQLKQQLDASDPSYAT